MKVKLKDLLEEHNPSPGAGLFGCQVVRPQVFWDIRRYLLEPVQEQSDWLILIPETEDLERIRNRSIVSRCLDLIKFHIRWVPHRHPE